MHSYERDSKRKIYVVLSPRPHQLCPPNLWVLATPLRAVPQPNSLLYWRYREQFISCSIWLSNYPRLLDLIRYFATLVQADILSLNLRHL